jgi:ubiquinol-cytochrome c reductase cytochrome c1 subunit
MRRLLRVVAGAALLAAPIAVLAQQQPNTAPAAGASTEPEISVPPKQHWSFDGPFGTIDRAAAQRGFQVYNEVCSRCHAMSLVYYRDLEGIGYTADEVKAFAAQKQVTDGPNDQGEMFQRPGRPSDKFVAPFPNEQAARAALNGALPPDLSLIVKARAGGPDYVHGIVTGYKDPPPPGVQLMEGMQYNEYFPGHQIAMPPPLAGDDVQYADGTKATVDQESSDVVTFLTWASEPTMEERKYTGAKVLIFLLAMSGVLYGAKRKIWGDVH